MQIRQITDPESNVFDRQERISWWDQEKLARARVMVVGAGAIGNETLKNLVLLGVKHFFIIDLDIISTSNLSRTVLFGPDDIGKSKAEVAAKRTKELALTKGIHVNWYAGDLVWEIGLGIFKEMDLVLGCVDNVEARFAINTKCVLVGTPWIDAGIHELGVRVNFFNPPASACYDCITNEQQRLAKDKRYSCGLFKRKTILEGKIPTTQIAAALVAALQVQEAIKYFCGQSTISGKQIYFQGKVNDFDLLSLAVNPNCKTHHLTIEGDILQFPYSSNATVKDLLLWVKDQVDKTSTLTFQGEGWAFLKTVPCRCCNTDITFMRPSYRIFDVETICDSCLIKNKHVDENNAIEDDFIEEALYEIDLNEEEEVLNLTLQEFGIPLWHIVSIITKEGKSFYVEILGDRDRLIS